MKLSLVYPRFPDPDNIYKVPPLGLAYIAAYVRETFEGQIEVSLLDANAFDWSVDETLARLERQAPDMVGLSAMTPQADFAYALTGQVKGWRDDIVVVHGGVHPTAMPTLSLRAGADFVVLGEGEESFGALLTALLQKGPVKGIPGLAVLEDGQLRRTPDRPLIADLDAVPAPAWDLLDHEAYNENIHVSRHYALPIMGSRGCPHDCSFCASRVLWRRRVRFRSPSEVVAEIVEHMFAHGVSRFHFYDDNFLLNRDWAAELCQELQNSVVCRWVCLTRAADINRNVDLLPAIRDAGCCGFEIGVESGDEQVLAQTNKRQVLSEVKEAISKIVEGGFEYLGIQLMTFNEGETVEGHRRHSHFVARLIDLVAPYDVVLSIGRQPPFIGQFATPYPGTRFYTSAPETGRVLTQTWADYVTARVNYIPNSLLEQPVRRAGAPAQDLLDRLEQVNRQLVFVWPDHLGREVPGLDEMLRAFMGLLDRGGTLSDMIGAIQARFELSPYMATKFAAVNFVAASQLGLIRALPN